MILMRSRKVADCCCDEQQAGTNDTNIELRRSVQSIRSEVGALTGLKLIREGKKDEGEGQFEDEIRYAQKWNWSDVHGQYSYKTTLMIEHVIPL